MFKLKYTPDKEIDYWFVLRELYASLYHHPIPPEHKRGLFKRLKAVSEQIGKLLSPIKRERDHSISNHSLGNLGNLAACAIYAFSDEDLRDLLQKILGEQVDSSPSMEIFHKWLAMTDNLKTGNN